MNEEIKEILDKLKIKNDRYSHHLKYNISYENKDEDYEAHLLLNYITNLQNENEKLKELEYKFFYCSEDEESFTLDDYLKIGNELYDCEEKMKDYKQRNEKAIEYIKSKKAIINTDYIRIFDLFEIEEQGYTKDLLNILEGGDEN